MSSITTCKNFELKSTKSVAAQSPEPDSVLPVLASLVSGPVSKGIQGMVNPTTSPILTRSAHASGWSGWLDLDVWKTLGCTVNAGD